MISFGAHNSLPVAAIVKCSCETALCRHASSDLHEVVVIPIFTDGDMSSGK